MLTARVGVLATCFVVPVAAATPTTNTATQPASLMHVRSMLVPFFAVPKARPMLAMHIRVLACPTATPVAVAAMAVATAVTVAVPVAIPMPVRPTEMATQFASVAHECLVGVSLFAIPEARPMPASCIGILALGVAVVVATTMAIMATAISIAAVAASISIAVVIAVAVAICATKSAT